MNQPAQALATSQQEQQLSVFLDQLAPDFDGLVHEDATLSFARECHFAKQQLTKSDYSLSIARGNPDSVKAAMLNLATLGDLSLNPANNHAYLVPRDKQICLDISYRGLCKLATDARICQWVQAKMVYQRDYFEMRGIDKEPTHNRNPFGSRGEFEGVYCVIKLTNGDYLTETMAAEDVYKIRDASQSYKTAETKKKFNSVWHKWFDQMAMKAVIKRASKMWPTVPGSERFNKAVRILNEQDGNETIANYEPPYSLEQKEYFDQLIESDNALGLYTFAKTVSEEVVDGLFNSFEKGKKTESKAKFSELHKAGQVQATEIGIHINELFEADEGDAVDEAWLELSTDERTVIADELTGVCRAYCENLEVS